MTILEKKSKRKVKALKAMVESQEYSPAFALEKLENYYDKGRIISFDYEPLAEYLENLINPVEEETEEENIENSDKANQIL